ncbi:DUF4402 domain-containing protein [Novosphingobium sp.]|uniref:DUF4402 domain-containing protein n=1 Tax=Novosphingobium sp. TaxID=1874826 RepID=UPI003BAC51A0
MACALAGLSGTAFAAPSSSTVSGAAQAVILTPLTIAPVNALQFGQLTRPTAAGTVVMSPAGTITTTGGVLTSTAIAQTASRGPGTFTVVGEAGRAFSVSLPTVATLRQGARNMRLSTFRSNWTAGAALSASRTFALSVGATLHVGANQTTGTYTGSYTVTVTYQ